MAVTTVSLTQPQNNGNNNTAVKAWGSAINSLFSGAGLLKTSDAGQINWSTTSYTPITTANSINVIGYEVWQFNDSLQATKPTLVRAEYRQIVNQTGHTSYQINIVVGTATNGSGTLTGTTTQQFWVSTFSQPFNIAADGFSGTVSCFSSGDGSSLVLALGPTVTTGTALSNGGLGTFYVDRTRDASGAITGEGVVVGCAGWQNNGAVVEGDVSHTGSGSFAVFGFTTNSVATLGSTSTTANIGVTLPACVPSTLSSGTTVGFQAPTVICNSKVNPPILAAIAYFNTDITIGSTVTLTLSGSSHTYYCLGSFCAYADRLPGTSSAALAVRYE